MGRGLRKWTRSDLPRRRRTLKRQPWQRADTALLVRRACECLTVRGYIIQRAVTLPIVRSGRALGVGSAEFFGCFHIVAAHPNGLMRFVSVTTRRRMPDRTVDIDACVPLFAGGVTQEVWGDWFDTRRGEQCFSVRIRTPQGWAASAPEIVVPSALELTNPATGDDDAVPLDVELGAPTPPEATSLRPRPQPRSRSRRQTSPGLRRAAND
jgi:hypothetical protein